MRFDPSIESQLTASAAAADRANRPRLFVVAPAIFLLGAVILTLITWQRFSLAKRFLSARLSEQAQVRQLIEYADELEAAHPDVAELFPINALMDANIDEIAREIWGESGPANVSGKSNPRSLGLNKQIERSDVDVSFSSPVAIDDLFEFIHRVLTDEPLEGVFLAKVDIRPTVGGWVGSIRFRLYERAR